MVHSLLINMLLWSKKTSRLSMPCFLFWIAQHNYLRGLQYLSALTIFTYWQKINQQHPFPISEHTAHDLSCWSNVFQESYVPPLYKLFLRFQSDARHPVLVTSYCLVLKNINFIIVSSEKPQSISKSFGYIEIGQLFWHPIWRQFPIT